MSIIKTINLNKIYNETVVPVHAVKDVNLEFEQGEFTAIIGPSGCGKTTLLNLIGGLDSPTSGEVIIDGTNISNLKPKEVIDFRLRNIGFVFQSYNLVPVLTAKENVEFIMQLQGSDKSKRDERVKILFEQIGLIDRMNDRPSKMSGGQQQRVAVARALASKPKFILADEPTANLDSAATSNLLDIMLKLNETENTTFIFSTHDSRVIERARRLITLKDGQVEKVE
ncbi:MAG: ABC transporter ATP-binding protein [Ignavibacteriae bacterium]|nr:ABC transporter ATP-binding protein [Ignavibacteriota bacterium]MCB9209172.1 ABC transporter ATP-binding protein [Ignavibacteriales bacterium]MCB9219578.1 ABC transporter ATP-binding protein [Ignavibacteriales bacterium]MCB9257820.1 ABC transporter ATP-binding protein [Ignavibacteriales bacterium]